MMHKDMPILIADDYRSMLRIMRNFLEELGFCNIDEASDGQAAFDLMERKRYELVISDWNMEPMSGFDLLKKVRADANLKHIAFILVTAEARPENVIAAKQAGVNNYIVKPFSLAVLKQKIQSVMSATV
jgi:two-component system, chemotaxis family, chemotaxis protein CheY